MNGRIEAQYWIETAFPLEQAAEVLAGEQSSGTFVKVPGETPELRARFGARVEEVKELESVLTPSLPGAAVPRGVTTPVYRRARIRVTWPIEKHGTFAAQPHGHRGWQSF